MQFFLQIHAPALNFGLSREKKSKWLTSYLDLKRRNNIINQVLDESSGVIVDIPALEANADIFETVKSAKVLGIPALL